MIGVTSLAVAALVSSFVRVESSLLEESSFTEAVEVFHALKMIRRVIRNRVFRWVITDRALGWIKIGYWER